MNRKNLKQLGVSLVEIMLVLVLILTLSALGIKYYGQVSEQVKINQAVAQVDEFLAAAYEWKKSAYNWCNNPAGLPITNNRLIDDGLLPEKYRQDSSHENEASPWQSTISVICENNTELRIAFMGIPKNSVCQQMVDIYQNKADSVENHCDTRHKMVIFIYH